MDCEHITLRKQYHEKGIGLIYMDYPIYMCVKCNQFFAIDLVYSQVPEIPEQG